MANEVKAAFDLAYRNYETDGVADSGPHAPAKRELRNIGQVLQDRLDSIDTKASTAADGIISLATLAELEAVTPGPGRFPRGEVWGDGENNGVYSWSGSAWVYSAPLGLTALGNRLDALDDLLTTTMVDSPNVPAVDLNFTKERYFPIQSVADLTSLGTEVRVGAAPWLGRNLGAECFKATTNLAASPTLAGAVLGVVGSGGSLPTGWTTDDTVGGMTLTVTEIDDDFLELRWQGTPAATAYAIVNFASSTAITATNGVTYTASFESLVVDADGITTTNAAVIERTIDGDFAAWTIEGFTPSDDVLFPIEVRHVQGANPRITHAIVFAVTSGVGADVTFRVARPQIEASTFRTPFADGARAADMILLRNPAALAGIEAYTSVIGFRPSLTTGTATIWQVDDGTYDNRFELHLDAYIARLSLYVATTLIFTLELGRVLPLVEQHVCLTVDRGFVRASLMGKPAELASFPVTSALALRLGNGHNGPLNGWITRYQHYNAAVDAAEVSVRSRAGFYDDFDRANGAPGTAPTGQVYTQIAEGSTSGVVEAAIEGGKLVADDSGESATASYTGIDFGLAPKIFMAAFTLGPGSAGGGGVTLIAEANGLGPNNSVITSGSVHVVIGDQTWRGGQWEFDGFTAEEYTPPGAIFFQSPALATDQTTIHRSGYVLVGNGIVAVMPNGILRRITDAGYQSKNGRYMFFEHFWIFGFTQQQFVAVAAEN